MQNPSLGFKKAFKKSVQSDESFWVELAWLDALPLGGTPDALMH